MYMCRVGAIPQHHSSLAHDFAAGIYFFSAVIWMCLHSYTTLLLAEHHNDSKSAQQRRVAYFRAFLTVFAFTTACVMQILADNFLTPAARATAAILEFVVTASWLVYIATFFSDFSGVEVKLADSYEEHLVVSGLTLTNADSRRLCPRKTRESDCDKVQDSNDGFVAC